MKENRPSVGIITMGCKVNQYESEAIAEAFEAVGFSVLPPREICDFYVINTCTVTGESDRKAGQIIRRAIQKNPAAYILVTGCYSQRAPEELKKIAGIDFICGNRRKKAVVEAAQKLLAVGRKNEYPELDVGSVNDAPFEPMCITHFNRTRAYVKIEDGCENHCTYCAIRGARGCVRSKPIAEIVAEVEKLTAGGCREVVLTGIETASFGKDLQDGNLADLLEAVDRIEGIGRVRLGSMDPSLFKEDFVNCIAKLHALAPHFHLSVQSGSSAVLAAMKRKYNKEQALAGVARLRNAFPALELTADFIVGFPGETEADFADTLDFVKQAEFLQIHVFPYSKRAGTPAALMSGQISAAVKKERSAKLIALGEEEKEKRLAASLQTPERTVLFETYENGIAIGHTDSFLEVALPSPVSLHSVYKKVKLIKREGDRLLAESVD